jgi:hypothetical protein
MRGHGQKFTRQQEAAITALLQTTTLTEAARQAGIHIGTLKRWLEDPVFQRHYRAARREVLHGAQVLLLRAGSTAVRTLVNVMNDGDEPATARVSAARCVLDFVFQRLAQDDLEARVAELEAQLRDQLGRTNGRPYTTHS